MCWSHQIFFCNIFIHSSKSRLIKRDDLIVNWQIFYVWVKLILFNNDESYSLIALPKFVIDLNKSFLIFLFSVILKNHFCIVYVVVDRIFRQQQHKKFLMNFNRFECTFMSHSFKIISTFNWNDRKIKCTMWC